MPEPDAQKFKFLNKEKVGNVAYLNASFDAGKTVLGLLGSEVKNILGLLGRDLLSHDLTRRNGAHLQGNQGVRPNLGSL
jgi:hypothetical protein